MVVRRIANAAADALAIADLTNMVAASDNTKIVRELRIRCAIEVPPMSNDSLIMMLEKLLGFLAFNARDLTFRAPDLTRASGHRRPSVDLQPA